MALLWLSD